MKCCNCSECLTELDQLILESEELYEIACVHIQMLDECVEDDSIEHLQKIANVHINNLENKYHNIILQIKKLLKEVV